MEQAAKNMLDNVNLPTDEAYITFKQFDLLFETFITMDPKNLTADS